MQITIIRIVINFMCIKILFRKWRAPGQGLNTHKLKPDKEIPILNKNVGEWKEGATRKDKTFY
jgi:hypothetical protein